jgi:hypothetical protein
VDANFERGYNSLTVSSAESLLCASSSANASSPPMYIILRQPKELVVTLACKRVDSSIVGSKLVWKESNEGACVVDALGPSLEGV